MKRTLPFILYAILILIVFWGVLWPPEGKILFGPDITRYHYWQRQFLGNHSNWEVSRGGIHTSSAVSHILSIHKFLSGISRIFSLYLSRPTRPFHGISPSIFLGNGGMYTLLCRVITNIQSPISNGKNHSSLITHHSSLNSRLGPLE